ncbi:phosphotransferase family protein [Paeniglutamicibacter kerguelensis]|uniref:Aminoglycoside phosphotransferase (APT) family kinase protein n=1 Tax=Paeniglutamicibacter kerguelensis TaxID=254788 RepID=A0ABS4XBH9_9MICC|nr:aminoglycoside phosphotransferase (APT) family kinase protein [Paeniglutamicibacter kerguelensis]
MIRVPLPREIALAQSLHPGPAWESGHVNVGGQFHVVLVAENEAVLRISRTRAAALEMQRRVDLVEALAPRLGFELPTALTPVWHGNDCSAVVQRYVPGSAHAPHRGDAAALRRLVEELAGIDVAPLAGLLARPFAFNGPWTAVKTAATLRALPTELVADAELVLATIAGFASIPPALVHGDLAGHNVHWLDGRLVGVLDWDLAAAWDPALNSAYLGLWHGESMLDLMAPTAQEAWRARVWLGAMSLESIYNVGLANDPAQLEAMVARVAGRIRRAAAAARS